MVEKRIVSLGFVDFIFVPDKMFERVHDEIVYEGEVCVRVPYISCTK